MTTQAKKVLGDLRQSYLMLENETNYESFRVLWVAAITLARAIGHILDKVDSRQSELMKVTVSNKWKSLKENKEVAANKIFFEFIEDERNKILKEYEFGLLSSPIDLFVVDTDSIPSKFTLGDGIYIPLQNGFYVGTDCRDVLAEAIQWWEEYINEIDAEIK
ncbi:hypothetical protein [Psychrobacter sp. PAMC 21119]|uniref:hypothetical protein n=1 Tax=Psychrobacter sp. PAMC 21119 TaxID=1112209 RepID=UPI000287D625|nr:hypothetical protein [Psychrobacter sp. PAMC 21119]